MSILRAPQVAYLASLTGKSLTAPHTAARQAAALAAYAAAISDHRELPLLRGLDVKLHDDGSVGLEGQPARPADLVAVAAWAHAYGTVVVISAAVAEGRERDPYAVRHCSAHIELSVPFGEHSTWLTVWTAVKPGMGDEDVDRLLGLNLGDRVDESGDVLAVSR